MPCYSPLKGFQDAITGGLVFKRSQHTFKTLEVACGQCLGCRLDRALMWSMRIVHESVLHADYEGNAFITLTYRDPEECDSSQFAKGHYIPGDYSLRKQHFQKFIKRLRKYFPQKIRYFHCGEYGELGRPHYHACLFNCSFNDMELFKSTEGIHTYTSATLEQLWPYGFSTIGEVNYDTAQYTARYCLKKITGHMADDHYLRCDEYGVAYWLQPEYVTMSLKPGIGHDWYQQFKNDVFPADETPVPGKGVISKVPRYYQTILESEDPDQLKLVKAMRQAFISAHRADFTPERLHDKYRVQKAKQATKMRELS